MLCDSQPFPINIIAEKRGILSSEVFKPNIDMHGLKSTWINHIPFGSSTLRESTTFHLQHNNTMDFAPRTLLPHPNRFLLFGKPARERSETELRWKKQAYILQKCFVKFNHENELMNKCQLYFWCVAGLCGPSPARQWNLQSNRRLAWSRVSFKICTRLYMRTSIM